MTTNARIGHGATFKIGNGASPEVFTAVASEVRSIGFPAISRDTIDASHTLSPNQWREFIAGMIDAGEMSIEFNLVPGTADTTLAALFTELGTAGSATAKNRQIVFPDTSQLDFAAIFTGFDGDIPIADNMTATANFKITGAVTLTQA